MKSFKEYLEIINEAKKTVRFSGARSKTLQQKKIVKSEIKTYSEVQDSVKKKLSKIENEINNAFKKFRSNYVEKIDKNEVFDFKEYDNFNKTPYEILYKGQKNIKDSLKKFDDMQDFYKSFFGVLKSDDEKDVFSSIFLSLFDQEVKLDNNTKINMADEIIDKINDNSIKELFETRKEKSLLKRL